MRNDPLAASQCVVTGGCGFIGSNLVRQLLDRDAQVTVLDNLSTGRLSNLPHSSRLQIKQSNLVDFPELESLLRRADYVFHLAVQIGNVNLIAALARFGRT